LQLQFVHFTSEMEKDLRTANGHIRYLEFLRNFNKSFRTFKTTCPESLQMRKHVFGNRYFLRQKRQWMTDKKNSYLDDILKTGRPRKSSLTTDRLIKRLIKRPLEICTSYKKRNRKLQLEHSKCSTQISRS
jgi:hypothetical protein